MQRIIGEIEPNPDKSLSHRALMFAALAQGSSYIQNLSEAQDVKATLTFIQQLGVTVQQNLTNIKITSPGWENWQTPSVAIDCKNSGTTARLSMGLVSCLPKWVCFIGDASVSRRPMHRVLHPLSQMGVQYRFENLDGLPVWVKGNSCLKATSYAIPVASAQIKSALLIAGLYAHGSTILTGQIDSRDHTERLLQYLDCKLERSAQCLKLIGPQRIMSFKFTVPGDFSSASFWLAAASILPGSSLVIKNVNLNPTRIGFLKVLQKMQAHIEYQVHQYDPEPIGDIYIQYAPLYGVDVDSNEVASMIDEIPLLAICAVFAKGITQLSGANELRFKETDRLLAIQKNFSSASLPIHLTEDGFQICGPHAFSHDCVLDSYEDHRIAMAFSIARLTTSYKITIQNTQFVNISYPQFFEDLKKILNF